MKLRKKQAGNLSISDGPPAKATKRKLPPSVGLDLVEFVFSNNSSSLLIYFFAGRPAAPFNSNQHTNFHQKIYCWSE